MKIKEFIEILQMYDPESVVAFEWDSAYANALSFKEYQVKRDKETPNKEFELYIELDFEDVPGKPYRDYMHQDAIPQMSEGCHLLVIDVSDWGRGWDKPPKINPPLKREEQGK